MANISAFLSNIKTAIYGEDVRDSIHDAIKAINDDASAVISSAQSTIDSYVRSIEIYDYVDTLPAKGSEQKIYAVQDTLEFEDAWNRTYNSTFYPYNGIELLPIYLAIPQSRQIVAQAIGGNDYQRWMPHTLTSQSSYNNLGHAGHLGGMIFAINSYEPDEVDIANPKYAMYTLDIVAGQYNDGRTEMISTQLTDILIPATSQIIRLVNKDDYWILEFNNLNFIPNAISKSDSNIRCQYVYIGLNEFIYDETNQIWAYNHSYRYPNAIKYSQLYNSDVNNPVILFGDNGLVSVSIKSDDSPTGTYNGLVGWIDSNLIDSIYYMSGYENGDLSVTKIDKDIDIDFIPAVSSGTGYSKLNIHYNLTNPYQIIIDSTYSGRLYLWNEQLKHYIALKAEAEVSSDSMIYQFIETPSEKHIYPSDIIKWRILAQNWAYLSTKGIVSTYHHYGRSIVYYLSDATYNSSTDIATFKYVGFDNETLKLINISLNCDTGNWTVESSSSMTVLSTNSEAVVAGNGIELTKTASQLTIGMDTDYIPTGYTATLLTSGWTSTSGTYTQTLTIAGANIDTSEAYAIHVAPTANSRTEWINCQVACAEANGTSYTFVATSQPSSNLDIYVTIQKINGQTVITQS